MSEKTNEQNQDKIEKNKDLNNTQNTSNQIIIFNNPQKNPITNNEESNNLIDEQKLNIINKEIENNISNIFKAYNNFYDCGNFDKLIRACYRFLKRIKGANEYDMNDTVIRYLTSCICMNDYSNCINIIDNIGQNYVLFDYNIYIFLLYFAQGRYDEACETILKIKTNISEIIFDTVSEKDLAFYFSFCLLYFCAWRTI